MARVLIVDDEDTMREALRLALERDGHEVYEAPDGDSGTRVFRDKRADLVITDLIMPQKEGIETIRELRRRFPDVKIIALSGRGGVALNANLEHARRVGADVAIQKPCQMEEVRDAVRELLKDAPQNVHDIRKGKRAQKA